MTFKATVIPLACWALMVGCKFGSGNGAGSAEAEFHYHVLELSADTMDAFIRKSDSIAVEDSAYAIGTLEGATVSDLVDRVADEPGILAKDSRHINWWPRIADSYAFSIADGEFLGGSMGSLFFGVREVEAQREMRVEGTVTHSINTRTGLPSKIYYEGPVPKDNTLVLFAPFERKDGVALFHVLIFEVKNWQKM